MRLFVFAVLLSVAFAAEDQLPFTKKTLQMEIDEVKKQIAEEERVWAEEKAREDEAEVRRQERLKEFRGEKAELQTSLNDLENKIRNSIHKIEVEKNKKISWENRFKILSNAVLEESKVLDAAMPMTIPYQKEKRVEAVKLITRDMRQEKISPEEGFSRLFATYLKEIRMSSDAELYSGEVELSSGEKVAVKYIRVGKQLLAYSSPTGAHLGILRRKNNKDWVWVKQDELEFDARKAIRDALAVAEGKAVPGFVEIPFWLDDFSRDDKPVAKEETVATENGNKTPETQEGQ